MTRSVTGAAWIINLFKGLHQADSGGAHVGLGQSLIVNNKFAAGANIRLWRLSANAEQFLVRLLKNVRSI